MDEQDKPILLRDPVRTMTVGAIIFFVLGLVLTLTAVGSIAGIPMLIVALALAGGAWMKNGRHTGRDGRNAVSGRNAG